MRARFVRSRLGRRLRLAFLTMMALTALLGGISMMAWERLSTQVAGLVERSLPTISTTYQLERVSNRLLLLLTRLQTPHDELMQQQMERQIEQAMGELEQIYLVNVRGEAEHARKIAEFGLLRRLIDEQNALLRNQIHHAQGVALLHKQLIGLHQDLVEEMTPLLQEVEWHLLGQIGDGDNGTADSVVHEFSLLQDLAFKENELNQLVGEIMVQRYERELDNAFVFIGYKIEEIHRLTSQLTGYPSTVTHRQILEDLIQLVRPEGELHRLLRQDVDNHARLGLLQPRLDALIQDYHRQVQAAVQEASQDLATLNLDTASTARDGKRMILLVLGLTLLVGGFVLVVLISRRLIGRLNQLSQDLANVSAGNLESPVTVSGHDEIGQLGERLRAFCGELREMEQTNALNLINNTQASLITCFADGTVESVNPRALALLGGKEYRQRPLWLAFPGAGQGVLQDQFSPESLLVTQGASDCLVEREEQGERRYLHVDLRRYRQGEVSKFIITITDVTRQELTARELTALVAEQTRDLQEKNQALRGEVERRTQAQAELLQAQDELIQAAKMAVVGQTMTSMAHELNQPLSALSTYLFTNRMALEQGDLAQLGENTNRMEHLAQRMRRIVGAVRQFARKSPADRVGQWVDLAEVADNALLLLEARARRDGSQLSNDLPRPMPIFCDPLEVEQVLINLLVNGLDAVAGAPTRTLHILALADNCLAVSDSGQGFPDDLLPNLFKPFTTTKEVGLGLGLSICRSLMERQGGHIYPAATLEGGAMMILEFAKP